MNGSQATGGAGALAPVSQAVRSIYDNVFGAPWMVLAVTAAGVWAMWKALVQRRYTETAGALGLSLIFTIVALAFVTQPERTIGQASRWTNELSAAFLSLSNSGTLTDEGQARQQASDQLFGLLVSDPWAVLDFGGLEHCVRTPVKDPPESVAVRPLSKNPGRDGQLSGQLRDGTQISADGKACVNDRNKYAAHFLAYPPESDDRNSEYDALNNGDTGKLPDSDPAKKGGGYQLSGVDKPAADAMGKGGQFQRLLLAVVIFIGELGAWLLLGALSIGVILAQVLVLLLLAFAPVALVAGIYPGRGHDLFRGWLARLATFLVRKAIYSLILAVLLAVVAALQDATTNLGWLLSFGLQALFLWAVFVYRHQLTQAATHATTGAEGARTERLSLPSLYWASRVSRAVGRSGGPSGNPSPPAPAPATATDPRARPLQSRVEHASQNAVASPPAAEDQSGGGEPVAAEPEQPTQPVADPAPVPAAVEPPGTSTNPGDSAATPAAPRPAATPTAPRPAATRATESTSSPATTPRPPSPDGRSPGSPESRSPAQPTDHDAPPRAPASTDTPSPANAPPTRSPDADHDPQPASLVEQIRADHARLRRRQPDETEAPGRPAVRPVTPPPTATPPVRHTPAAPNRGRPTRRDKEERE